MSSPHSWLIMKPIEVFLIVFAMSAFSGCTVMSVYLRVGREWIAHTQDQMKWIGVWLGKGGGEQTQRCGCRSSMWKTAHRNSDGHFKFLYWICSYLHCAVMRIDGCDWDTVRGAVPCFELIKSSTNPDPGFTPGSTPDFAPG